MLRPEPVISAARQALLALSDTRRVMRILAGTEIPSRTATLMATALATPTAKTGKAAGTRCWGARFRSAPTGRGRQDVAARVRRATTSKTAARSPERGGMGACGAIGLTARCATASATTALKARSPGARSASSARPVTTCHKTAAILTTGGRTASGATGTETSVSCATTPAETRELRTPRWVRLRRAASLLHPHPTAPAHPLPFVFRVLLPPRRLAARPVYGMRIDI